MIKPTIMYCSFVLLMTSADAQGFALTNKSNENLEIRLHYSYPQDNPNYYNKPAIQTLPLATSWTTEIDVNYLMSGSIQNAN